MRYEMPKEEQLKRSTVELSKGLLLRVKQYATSINKPIKKIVSTAIEEYLKDQKWK